MDNKVKRNTHSKKISKPKDGIVDTKHYLALGAILLITIIAYLPVFHNGFVWDDAEYIQNNPLIKSLDIKAIFSQFYFSNYQPVTILFYAIEYHSFVLNEAGYHAINLALHLFNVMLVFYAIFLLSNRAEIALVAALLFGIHPLHVESVAWASGLKDVLYTLFFLASYIFYIKFIKTNSRKFYFYSLLLFLLSLLSKGMAASLPLVFILTDYFIHNNPKKNIKFLNAKSLLEKIPFFTLSLVFGILSVLAQQARGAIHDITVIPFFQRIIVACYGFISYLIKIFLPIDLCAFYPYPYSIPLYYYVYVLLFIALVIFVVYSIRFSKKIMFGIGFFFAALLLVLQLLPVGGAIMADRYCYIASIGIFYLAAEGFYWLWNKNYKVHSIVLLSVFTLFFSIKTYSRCEVWKDEMTLWNDVISQYQIVPNAYNSRGNLLMKENKFNEALNDFNKAIELKPDFSDAYYNRGILYGNEKKYNEALNDYNKSIELNPGYFGAYNNRGNIFKEEKKYKEAFKDFSNAIELKPDFEKSYNNRGNVLMDEKKYDESIKDFDKAIELKPDYAIAYFNRAMAEYFSDKKDKACMDFQKSAGLGFQPASDFYNRNCK